RECRSVTRIFFEYSYGRNFNRGPGTFADPPLKIFEKVIHICGKRPYLTRVWKNSTKGRDKGCGEGCERVGAAAWRVDSGPYSVIFKRVTCRQSRLSSP